ncbi:MAG: DUF2064 domain-containing protein [Lautropia sp.]
MNGTLIVFGRWPTMHRVKTRLARTVGAARALAVYRGLLVATLVAGDGCRSARRRVFDVDGPVGPPRDAHAVDAVDATDAVQATDEAETADAADAALDRLLRAHRWQVREQVGEGLGERMRRSLSRAAAEAAREFGCAAPAATPARREAVPVGPALPVVLVGTDGAAIDAAYLDAAFAALVRHEVVLGPTADGGYLLIGTRVELPHTVFEQHWSTDAVLDGTRAALRRASIPWTELPTVFDIDTEEDLVHASRATPPDRAT